MSLVVILPAVEELKFVIFHYLSKIVTFYSTALIPREARLINLSGRAGPSGAKPREFERKIYLYIYICVYVYIFEGVRTMTSDCLASSGAKFAYIEKNMRA